MAEVLGRLEPDADPKLFNGMESLTEYERAQASLAVAGRIRGVIEEVKGLEAKFAIGHFIVGLDDGRTVAVPYEVYLGDS